DAAARPRQVAQSRANTELTARELDVLRLVAGGDANGEIARRLGLSVHTVERHLANVYPKIGARGRADATAYAIKHGIVCAAGVFPSYELKKLGEGGRGDGG